MTIEAVSHIAVGVRDMEVALGFYRDVLGLRVTADNIEEFPQGPGQEPAQGSDRRRRRPPRNGRRATRGHDSHRRRAL